MGICLRNAQIMQRIPIEQFDDIPPDNWYDSRIRSPCEDETRGINIMRTIPANYFS